MTASQLDRGRRELAGGLVAMTPRQCSITAGADSQEGWSR